MLKKINQPNLHFRSVEHEAKALQTLLRKTLGDDFGWTVAGPGPDARLRTEQPNVDPSMIVRLVAFALHGGVDGLYFGDMVRVLTVDQLDTVFALVLAAKTSAQAIDEWIDAHGGE